MRRWWRWTSGRCTWWTRCGRPLRWHPANPRAATTSTRAAARPMCAAWSSPKPVAIRPTPRKIVPRPNLRERSNGSRAVYPAARTIHLVLDNLNTHREKSLTATFGAQAGHRLWSRFTVNYTPKHGSCLNPAELEASLWSRQCLGRQRVASLIELRERTSAWNRRANRTKLKIDWRFSTADARRVFHYQRIATHESKH